MLTFSSRKICLLILSCFISVSISSQLTAQGIATQYGVVASAHPVASKAGLRILKEGGNAVDAAIASALILAVVEPYASGLGGGGFLTIKNACKNPVVIDYREVAPACATDSIYYSNSVVFKTVTGVGVNAVGVPGVAAGLALALEKYGSMDIAELVKPAIEIACYGYEVNQTMSDLILEKYGVISEFEETSCIYLNEGIPPSVGDTLFNKDFANTLRVIGKDGLKAFYENEIGNALTGYMIENNGCLTAEDLENYTALEKKPITGNYKGYEIISTPPPSGGGTHLIELLNIIENFDLQGMGLNSAEYIHAFAQALLIVQSDKARFMADPGFYNVPVEKLIDKAYASCAAQSIEPDSIMAEWQSEIIDFNESGSTTSFSIIDKDGNMVTITQSICLFFGSGITVPGTGILLNNHMSDFDNKPGMMNSIEPGKRPVSSIAPTIILKDGKPLLTIGTPGGSRIIGTLAQIIVNIADFNMTLQEAIDAPRFHVTKKKLHVESRIPEDVQKQLIEKGHEIEIHAEYDKYFGGAQGVMYDYENSKLTGAADPRRGGAVEGF